MLSRPTFDCDYFPGIRLRMTEYRIPVIEQINTDHGRFYMTPNGKKYPSMSTVVGMLGKEAIAQWRKRVGAEEAVRKSAHASKRGTTVHRLAELYILAEQDEFTNVYRKSMPDAQKNWTGLREEISNSITEVCGLETRMFSHQLRLAGTTDCIGLFRGKKSVIDFKTSGKPKKREWIDSYFMQCDGYATMWEELTDEIIEQLVVIIAVDGEDQPQVFIEPRGSSMAALKKLRLEFYLQNQC